jgi:hypothetical protein
MSRYVILVGGLFLGVGLSLTGVTLSVRDLHVRPCSGVTERNAQRIKMGMALSEVQALLGGPAHGGFLAAPTESVGSWGSDRVQVNVSFDRDGKVTGVQTFLADPRGPMERLHAWLGF